MQYKVTSARPLNKVTAAAAAGALAVILAWGLKQFAGIELPDTVQSAVTLLVSVGAAYLTPLGENEVEPVRGKEASH